MVPQFIFEVHCSYRRKIREPDDPLGGLDSRVLRAVRRSPRQGCGVQGERGPADHPGLAGILPRVQLDLSGRVRPVLGTRGLRPITGLPPWVVGVAAVTTRAYGSSRLRRDSRSARHNSALRLKFALASRPAISAETNSPSVGGFPAKSQTTSCTGIRPSPSTKVRYRATRFASAGSVIGTIRPREFTTNPSPSAITSFRVSSEISSGASPDRNRAAAIEYKRLRSALVRIIWFSSTNSPRASKS